MGSEEAGDARQMPRPVRSLDAGGSRSEVKPTPVRTGAPAATDDLQPRREREAESTTLCVQDVTWTIRVRGRGRAGTDTGPAPLLVLGFFRDTEEEPRREALVVARALEDLTARQLERAFDVSLPPPEPGTKKELFPETATRARKGDR